LARACDALLEESTSRVQREWRPRHFGAACGGRPATWQAERDALLVREKAHTRAGDAIAAARRRLPMVEVDPTITLIGPHGPVTLLEVFDGRRQLIAYLHMWYSDSRKRPRDRHVAAKECRRLSNVALLGPGADLLCGPAVAVRASEVT
jgi:hypothetical protein